jgi:hypothetical protein
VADFVDLIKFRTRLSQRTENISQLASLYQQFAQEDRELAEAGISDDIRHLQKLE